MAKQRADAVQRYVDMWGMPGLHPTNIELLQDLKTADTQHFTKNMDVVGTVSEREAGSRKWEKTHMIGVRTDIWRPDGEQRERQLRALRKRREAVLRREIKRSGRLDPKQRDELNARLESDSVMQIAEHELESQRLVLKLFKTTGTRVRWCGTIEQMTTTEVHNSMGSRRSLLSSAVMFPQSNFVTPVQQNHRTFRLPAIFTLGYYHQQRMWHLVIRQRWFSLGFDFDLVVDGQRLGKLDGRLLTCGHDSTIKLKEHPLSSCTEFVDLLTLFTATVGYHRRMRRSVKRRVHAAKRGEWHRLAIDDEELRLRHNGRAAA